MNNIYLRLYFFAFLSFCIFTPSFSITPTEAGFIDATAAPYFANNTGAFVTTTQLQSAINAARDQRKPLFLPAGTYRVNATLLCENTNTDRDDPLIIVGSSIDPANRTTIVLEPNTFTNASSPQAVIRNIAYPSGYPDTFNRIIQSIDIQIGTGNAGAIGLDWRGAEGCGIIDVNIDATGAYAGLAQLPGSGGSTMDVSITGGQYGINVHSDDGTNVHSSGFGAQPTPTITNVRFTGQTVACIRMRDVRGAFVMTGCRFNVNTGVPVFDGRGSGTDRLHLGGWPLLTDCVIECSAGHTTPLFNLITGTNIVFDYSVVLTNVYIRNASTVVNLEATINSSASGWTHFEQMVYSSGLRDGIAKPIFIDKSDQGNTYVEKTDGVTPSTAFLDTLINRHGWGDVMPSFETTNAVNVQDYSGSVSSGDWGPAIQAAINAAEGNGSNVVFIPSGSYQMNTGVTLGPHTKLLGTSHKNTFLKGLDQSGRRFGGSIDPYNDPKAMITTPDDSTADCMIADLWVSATFPFNYTQHNYQPTAHYGINWRAGRNSIIRNVNTQPQLDTGTNYRPSLVLQTTTDFFTAYNLQSLASPTTISGVRFESDCETQYFIERVISSRLLLETANSNKRLMTRSIPPHNRSTTAYDESNLTISQNGSFFSINSLKLANPSLNSKMKSDIKIEGYIGTVKVGEKVVQTKGVIHPREELINVNLNWTNVTSVVITSPNQFSVDDVVINGFTIDFESTVGTTIDHGTSSIDFAHSQYFDPFRDLPINSVANHFVRITGGVRWYNHWKHGDTWMVPDQGYVYIGNNHSPVTLYHFHAQHSMNDAKIIIENAKNVSLLGVKTENNLILAKATNSKNIRFIGHGGITTPPAESTNYRFEDCEDIMVVAAVDEYVTTPACQYCPSGNAILPYEGFGNYDQFQDYENGVLSAPGKTERPVIWRRGTLTDPWTSNTIANSFEDDEEDDSGEDATPEVIADAETNASSTSVAIDVFPNPVTTSSFQVDFEGEASLQLLNSQGTVLRELTGVDNVSIEVQGLESGIYFIRVDSETYSAIERIVLN